MSGWKGDILAIIAVLGGTTLALTTIYINAYETGKSRAEARYAKQLQKAQDEAKAKEAIIDQIALNQLAADQLRQSTHQEIVRESTKIIDRPVYRNRCMDADGLRILDDIAANAHGQNPAPSDDRPVASAPAATQP